MGRVLLIRHGECEANVLGVWAGQRDWPLTGDGRRQAEALAAALPPWQPDALLTSDLSRAYDTARPIAERLGTEPTRLPALRELNVGELDGLSGSEVATRYAEFQAQFNANPATPRLPGGESLAELAARVRPIIEAALHDRSQTIVVAHQGVVRIAILTALGIDLKHFNQLRTLLASWSLLETTAEGVQLTTLNAGPHVHD